MADSKSNQLSAMDSDAGDIPREHRIDLLHGEVDAPHRYHYHAFTGGLGSKQRESRPRGGAAAV